MATVIAILIIIIILALAVGCIIKEKKKGVKCIGCPAAGSCTKYDGAKRLEKEIRKSMKKGGTSHGCH